MSPLTPSSFFTTASPGRRGSCSPSAASLSPMLAGPPALERGPRFLSPLSGRGYYLPSRFTPPSQISPPPLLSYFYFLSRIFPSMPDFSLKVDGRCSFPWCPFLFPFLVPLGPLLPLALPLAAMSRKKMLFKYRSSTVMIPARFIRFPCVVACIFSWTLSLSCEMAPPDMVSSDEYVRS